MMKTIAFVDDERKILDGLRRMLRHHRSDWDMHFYSSGEAILDDLPSRHFDAVISDMRMPNMSGPAVLDAIKQQSPSTVRLALSGYAEMEMILESLHATHQFIAKPAEQEKISESIERAMQMQDSLLDNRLKDLLGSIDTLPSLPAIYDELMQEMASDDASIDAVGAIIERDVALSTGLLKIVNSAFFGLVRHIESPRHAASILGMEAVKNLALTTSVFSSFAELGGNPAQLEQLNINSQQLGVLTARLAKQSNLGKRAQDHAQIAGMMAHLGELVLLSNSELPLPVIAEAGGNTAANADGEHTAYDSPLVASYLLGIWALPFSVIEAVRWHRAPSESGVEALSPLAVVHAAWAMLKCYNETAEIDLDDAAIDTAFLQQIVDEKVLDKWVAIAIDFCSQSNAEKNGLKQA